MRDFEPANRRYGSIFNISVCSRRQQNVRYGPKSDQIDASQQTPLRANSDRMRCSKK
jgi:hypothetical protein